VITLIYLRNFYVGKTGCYTTNISRLNGEKDHLHLISFPFLSFGEIKTQKFLKIINDSETSDGGSGGGL